MTFAVQTYRYYDAEPETVTAAQERTEMVRRALGAVIRETDGGRVLSLRSALEEKDGAAVLDLTVHAVEQIGVPPGTLPGQRPLTAVSGRLTFRRYGGSPVEATPRSERAVAAFGGEECRCSLAGTKGGRRTPAVSYVPLWHPFDFPLAAQRSIRG